MGTANAGNDTYDRVTILLHWATVAIVVALFALAWFPGVIKASIFYHKTIGILLLGLIPIRILWRLFLGRKTNTSASEPLLLRLGAQAAHLALYALLLIVPLLGWLYQDAKALPVYAFGIELPMLTYYNREQAALIFEIKKIAAYGLLALIVAHAGAAIVYHHMMRKDGVLRSMLPSCLRATITGFGLLALTSGSAMAQAPFDVNKYAADLAASLAKACPMASTSDVAAHDSCRQEIGKGAESSMRDYHFLFGGQQPARHWLKDKKTSVFRGDLFQQLYMSLYMYTGKYRVETAADGLTVVGVQAYFRNGLPPGQYPYPFWHSNNKWAAYEQSNELRFRLDKNGKVVFAYRADIGSNENRGPYAHVERPSFLGEWMWRDDSGGAQPRITLFSGFYSNDNPTLPALEDSYRKMAISLRNADCTVCHQPEGHSRMNKLTLLQTPLHAATSIDAILYEVRAGKMPVDDHDDPKALSPAIAKALLDNGEAFKKVLDSADEWERANGRPKARKTQTR